MVGPAKYKDKIEIYEEDNGPVSFELRQKVFVQIFSENVVMLVLAPFLVNKYFLYIVPMLCSYFAGPTTFFHLT